MDRAQQLYDQACDTRDRVMGEAMGIAGTNSVVDGYWHVAHRLNERCHRRLITYLFTQPSEGTSTIRTVESFT